MTRSDKAQSLFENDFNCSQSVFAAFAADMNLSENVCLKIATPFGAGMARRQLTCGAVTGALMVLGMHYGKGLNDLEQQKRDTYEKTNLFLTRFQERNGSLTCLDLLEGLRLNNPEDYEQIKARNMFVTHCRRFVREAVQIAEELTATV
jgi:C_GCAxxG_C_C family probable redox protein